MRIDIPGPERFTTVFCTFAAEHGWDPWVTARDGFCSVCGATDHEAAA